MLQTKVIYQDTEKADKLLGEKGRPLMQHVLSLIENKAGRENWPLEQIIVAYWQDYEDKNWETVFLFFDFGDLDDNVANVYLESLTPDLNSYASTLSPELEEIFLTLIHYGLRLV